MPLESFTRATLRSAEFGFLGVVVYTRVQTPRRCGLPLSAGVLVWPARALRPLRTSCWMVGTTSPSRTFDCSGDRGPIIGSGADAGSDPPREDPRARACRRLLGSLHDTEPRKVGSCSRPVGGDPPHALPGTEIGSGVRARESPTERALPTRVLCARQRRQSSSGVVPATSGAATGQAQSLTRRTSSARDRDPPAGLLSTGTGAPGPPAVGQTPAAMISSVAQ